MYSWTNKSGLSRHQSLTDNIYINTYDKTIPCGIFLDKVKDHIPNFCIIEDIYKVKKNRKIRIRDMQQLERPFLKDLEKIKNLDLLEYKEYNIYNKFHEKYLQLIEKNIPYKMLPKRETKLKQNLDI